MSKRIELSSIEISRFWDKVDKRGQDECWLWTGAKSVQGYGRFRINGTSQGANRIAFWLFSHLQPGDLAVCHTCDNPPCVNPSHLFLGTWSDNMQDAANKGRLSLRRGKDNKMAKLTPQFVRQIRSLLSTGLSQKKIGERFGVGKSTIGRISTGETWHWVK